MALVIATRGSRLALWQAGRVRDRLREAHGLDIELRVVKTTGDRVTDVPLAAIGGRGLFTREVDRALLDGEAQLAVHSLKDLPTSPEPGLEIAAVLEREDPRDVLVFGPGLDSLDSLDDGAAVGTSSLRRRAQLLARRAELRVDDLRGNVDTRLERVAAGDYDAIILAAAGVLRLGLGDRIGEWLEPPDWLPAPGQGALAVVIREGDGDTRRLLAPLDHAATRAATTAERALLARLEGGCQVPIGALATVADDTLRLSGLVASLDGRTVLRGEIDGPADSAESLGRTLADRLIARGADAILDEIRATTPRVQAPPAP